MARNMQRIGLQTRVINVCRRDEFMLRTLTEPLVLNVLIHHAIQGAREKNMAQQQIIEGTGAELIEVLTQQPQNRFRLIKLPAEREFQTFEEALAGATSRTPQEVADARSRLIQASPAPRALPKGKTLEDVVMGNWPGDETDGETVLSDVTISETDGEADCHRWRDH